MMKTNYLILGVIHTRSGHYLGSIEGFIAFDDIAPIVHELLGDTLYTTTSGIVYLYDGTIEYNSVHGDRILHYIQELFK